MKYKDDPAILCWETANEAGGSQTNQQTSLERIITKEIMLPDVQMIQKRHMRQGNFLFWESLGQR